MPFLLPVVPIDSKLYSGLSHMLLRNSANACGLHLQDQEGNPGNIFGPEDKND